jgi:DNA-binding response OmpR family regulator
MNTIKHILIVDDEPNVRLMFRTALESAGYAVEEAADGEQALECLRHAPADLVLLDLQMPRLDGMATLRRLRDEGCEVPVVIVTAHGSIPDAVAAMRLGAIDFLSKPLTPDVLRKIVAEVLDRHGLPAAMPSPAKPVVITIAPAAIDLTPAKRALNQRDFDRAAKLLETALDLDPHSAEAHTLMGVLFESRGQDHAAYHAYKMALEADPHFAPAGDNMKRYCERFGLDYHSHAINPAAP